MAFEKELELARRAVREAGDLALANRRRTLEVSTKPDASPVTNADRDNEHLITRMLAEAFPDDGLLGEEGSRRPARSGRQWIVDPIDGTKDFVRGIPFWAVLLGLEAGGDIVVGACRLPVLGETYYAARGSGAWRESASGGPERLHVAADITEISRAVLCITDADAMPAQPFAPRLVEFLSRFWTVRNTGGALDAMLVASGRADAWLEPSAKPWDLAASKIIIEEAGGRFVNFDGGNSVYGGNCIACVPALEAEMLRFVRGGSTIAP